MRDYSVLITLNGVKDYCSSKNPTCLIIGEFVGACSLASYAAKLPFKHSKRKKLRCMEYDVISDVLTSRQFAACCAMTSSIIWTQGRTSMDVPVWPETKSGGNIRDCFIHVVPAADKTVTDARPGIDGTVKVAPPVAMSKFAANVF